MGYPKTLYKIVNNLQEENDALASGCMHEADGKPLSEYPKMVYLHPADKTQEHQFLIINSSDEKEAALKNGYQLKPHIPIAADDFDEIVVEVSKY